MGKLLLLLLFVLTVVNLWFIILFSERLKMDSSVMPDDEDGGEKNT